MRKGNTQTVQLKRGTEQTAEKMKEEKVERAMQGPEPKKAEINVKEAVILPSLFPYPILPTLSPYQYSTAKDMVFEEKKGDDTLEFLAMVIIMSLLSKY